MFTLFKYNKTKFEAGGLIPEEIPLGDPQIYKANEKFRAPRKIDFRDMCLASSNQGQSPHCVGYATAGFIEVQNWRTKHYPEQVDGDAIYAEAKKLDGNPNAKGTWLTFGIQASINLGLIKGKERKILANREDVKFALHEYGVCISAFMINDDWNYVERKNGLIRNTPNSKQLGGHAVLLCGYDDTGVYIQNSWSEQWGIHGFAILSWEQFDKQFKNAMVIEPSCNHE